MLTYGNGLAWVWHVPVTHQASAPQRLAGSPRHLLGRAGGLRRARWFSGLLLAAVSLPVLTTVLTTTGRALSLGSTLLLYLLLVLIVTRICGTVPGSLGRRHRTAADKPLAHRSPHPTPPTTG